MKWLSYSENVYDVHVTRLALMKIETGCVLFFMEVYIAITAYSLMQHVLIHTCIKYLGFLKYKNHNLLGEPK